MMLSSLMLPMRQGAYGDRRQELVFIGIGMNEGATRGAIVKALDECLLTDQEMEVYEGVREVRYSSRLLHAP